MTAAKGIVSRGTGTKAYSSAAMPAYSWITGGSAGQVPSMQKHRANCKGASRCASQIAWSLHLTGPLCFNEAGGIWVAFAASAESITSCRTAVIAI